MAKYDVTYACGHTGTVQLFGKVSARYEHLDWLATCDCPDCKEQARKKVNAANAAAAAEMDFPALLGTPKQIAWAESIRMEAYRKWMGAIRLADNSAGAQTALEAINYAIQHATSASEWIDNRNNKSIMLNGYRNQMHQQREGA